MRQHRQLFALLLVAIYAIASTFGAAFVICVESDGRQNVEALGATCCATIISIASDDADRESVPEIGTSRDDGCGDCQDHVEIGETETTRCEDSQQDPIPSSSDPPPAPPAIVAWPHDSRLDGIVRQSRARKPQSSPAIVCLRSVILRC